MLYENKSWLSKMMEAFIADTKLFSFRSRPFLTGLFQQFGYYLKTLLSLHLSID